MAVVALKPRRGYSFTDHAKTNPSTPPPGDRLDGEVDRINRAIGQIIDWVSVSLNSDGSLKTPKPRVSAGSTTPVGLLGPQNSTHIIAGADPTATAVDWAEVSAEWAEHMSDTIPPNILAVMGVTGDHWSSRWWANRAAQLVESFRSSPGPGGPARAMLVASPPAPASPGDLWWDTISGQLFVFYSDPSSSQWVPATNQPVTPAVAVPIPPVAASIPAPPSSGAILTLPDARPYYVNNATALASLTLRLPVVELGRVQEIGFARPVTVLTLQDNAGGAIPDTPTSAYGPGAAIQLRFEAPGWIYWK